MLAEQSLFLKKVTRITMFAMCQLQRSTVNCKVVKADGDLKKTKFDNHLPN